MYVLDKEKTKKLDGESKLSIRRNSMQTIFLARVLAMSAQGTSQTGHLVEPVNKEYSNLLASLRAFEGKMKDYIDPQVKWLDKAIDRTHAFGIANILETFAQLSTEQDEELYSQVCDVFHEIIGAQKKSKKLDLTKYRLLFQLIEDELKADSSGTPGRISAANNQLTFTFNSNANG